MPQIMLPNVAGGVLNGLAAGRQYREQENATQRQNQLAQLASQAYTAPASQQQNLLGQIASVDPRAAGAFQQQFQGQEDRRLQQLGGAARYLEQARQSGNPQQVQGAWNAVRPTLAQQMPEGQFPEQWDDESMSPVLHQVLAQTQGASGSGSSILSTYVDDQGQRVAVNRDGTTRVLGGADLGQNNQTITVRGADGRERQMTFNRRTGQYEDAQFGGGQPQPGQQAPAQPSMDTLIQQANQMARSGMPTEQIDAWLSQQAGAAPNVQVGGGNQLQTPQRVMSGSSPFVSRTPEEQAALTTSATEQARIGSQLAYADALASANIPQGYRRTPEGGLEPVPGSAAARDIAAEQRSRDERQANQSIAAETVVQDIGRALELMENSWFATGPAAAASRNIPGSPANRLEQFTNSVASNIGVDRLQAMRESSPTGGALGNVAVQQQMRLEQLLGSLDVRQPRAVLEDNIKRVGNIYLDIIHGTGNGPQRYALSFDEMGRRLEGGARQWTGDPVVMQYEGQEAPAPAGPAPGMVEGGYRFRGGNPADPNSWEQL